MERIIKAIEEKYLMSETIPLYGIKKKAYTVTDLI